MRAPPVLSLDCGCRLQIGLGASWRPFPGDQATWLGVVLLVLGLAFFYLGFRTKNRVFRARQRIGGFPGILVFVTWALSAAVVLFYFGLLERGGALVPSPIWPITYGSAGVTFFATLVLVFFRNKAKAIDLFLSAFAGTVVGVMVFELPYLLIISPQLGLTVQDGLWGESPLYCLVFASYLLLFLSSQAGVTRYTMFSLGAMFVVFSLWAFLTNFAFPSDPVSFDLNAISKILGFVSSFTLFVHKDTLNAR